MSMGREDGCPAPGEVDQPAFLCLCSFRVLAGWIFPIQSSTGPLVSFGNTLADTPSDSVFPAL